MGDFYVPPGKVRAVTLLRDDACDKQADALRSLADALTFAESTGDWAIVGGVNVALRAIVRGLEAIDDAEG